MTSSNGNIVCARCRRPILVGEPRVKETRFTFCVECKKAEESK
jgi:hypothetical protein